MEEEVLGKAYDGRLMRRLLVYIRPYRTTVLFSLVLLLLNAMLQVVGPLLTALAVDRYLAPSSKVTHTILDPFLSHNPFTGLGQISFLYFLALFFGMLCDFGEQYMMQWVFNGPLTISHIHSQTQEDNCFSLTTIALSPCNDVLA